MKKIISLLLTIIFVFLIGCSSNNIAEQTTTKPVENRGFIEVTGIEDKRFDIIDTDINDSTITILATNINNEDTDFYFYIIDAKTCALTKKKKISGEFNMESITGINRDSNNNINIYDDYNKKSAIFDNELNFIELKDYKPIDTIALYKDNPFYNDSFSTYEDCARFYNNQKLGEYVDILLFPDENDCFYWSSEVSNDYLKTNNRLALACTYGDSEDTFKILDFKNKSVVCEAKLKTESTEEAYSTPISSAINDKYAFTIIGTFYNDENSEYKAYVWDYRTGAKSKKFQFDKYDTSILDEEFNTISASLMQKYKINIIIDKEPDCTPGESDEKVEYNANKLKTLIMLKHMDKFFSLFPSGLFDEIYDEYENSNQIDVYIVKRIVNDKTAAFANIWEDTPIMCFSTDEFSFSQLPHEFMHILDIKLFNSFERENKNFWEEWEKQNYDRFYYGTDKEWEGKNLEYFVSAYAMTSQQEDRAELFQQLFSNAEFESDFSDHPKQLEKAKALCNYLRGAYTSLQNEENLIWETSIKGAE